MYHRRHVRLRLLGVVLAAAVVSSVVYTPSSTLSDAEPDALADAAAGPSHVTSVQIEWNHDAHASTRPGSVRLTADNGQVFETDDTVDVTAVGAGSDTCSAKTTVTARAAVVDVDFSACGVMLWELHEVAVSVSGGGTATELRSKVAALSARPAVFDGPVAQPGAPVAPGYTTTEQGGAERLTSLRLTVGDSTAEQLVGRRLVSVLFSAGNEPITYAGTVGTTVSNQGIWVENDPKTAQPVVVADMGKLAGGQAPRMTDVVQYRMVLLQPQRLGDGQTPANQFALTTAAGTIEGTGPRPEASPEPSPSPT